MSTTTIPQPTRTTTADGHATGPRSQSSDRRAEGGRRSQRAVHLVGSLPPTLAPTVSAGMGWILDTTADTDLLTLPCDPTSTWLTDWLLSLDQVPALRRAREGDATDYDHVPAYRVAPGHRLTPEDVSLHRVTDTAAAMAARDAHTIAPYPLPPHQVSIPHAVDMAYFAFSRAALAFTHLPIFREALLADIAAIHHHWPSTVFQLETPSTLISFSRTPSHLWPMLAYGLAHHTVRLISAAPRTARWIIHLCYGDLHHVPATDRLDLTPAVGFLTAVRAGLADRGYPAPTVHLPLATATTPPPTDPAFYTPLRRLPADMPVIAGLVDDTAPAASLTALTHTEHALGRPVRAVAAPCGLGRRDPADALTSTRLACDLAHHPAPGGAR